MQSLRSRKPSESRPKGAQRQGTVRAPKPAPRNAERRATRVGEKMKKRMSMRYADISAPTDASVPDMPALPIGMRTATYTQDEQRFTEEPREDPMMSELRLLDKDDFDPDACACASDPLSC